MDSYNFPSDLKLIRGYLGLSQAELGDIIGASRVSVSRYENGEVFPEDRTLERFYSFCFANKEKLGEFNSLKVQYLDDDKKGRALLFHGAKNDIVGPLDIHHTKPPVDLGMGFYAGENLRQASTWVASYPKGSVYCYYANLDGLRGMELSVEEKWMIAILFYRGRLGEYADSTLVKSIIQEIEQFDYLLAPIADNNVYQILEQFGKRMITDAQCSHALSATSLGRQYVFKNDDACQRLCFADRLYLCSEEKRFLINEKTVMDSNGMKKAQIALEKYRREGKYIDELLK